MSYIPPEQGSVRDRQNFDYDNEMLAGRGIASLLIKYPEVWVRKGRRGYHVVVDSEPDLIERYTIGDCWGRFNADLKRKKRGQPLADRTGVLFYYKNKKFKTRWVRVKPIEWRMVGVASNRVELKLAGRGLKYPNIRERGVACSQGSQATISTRQKYMEART